MVWKAACLLRFGEVGLKTPTLFFYYAKQNEMGTGDINSCSKHEFIKTLCMLEVEVVRVESEVCGKWV